MRYAVIGSGAMGYRYGVELQEKAGVEVDFIDAWQPNLDAVKHQGGVYVTRDGQNRRLVPINMYTPEGYDQTPDVWVVFMKQMQLAGMLERCKHLFNDDQIAFSLMNGWGHYEKLQAYFSDDRIFGGSAMIAAGLPEPGHGDFMGKEGEGSMTFCPLVDRDDLGEKGQQLFNDLVRGQFNPVRTENILDTCMPKIIFNAVINSICTTFRIRMGEFIAHPRAIEMARQLIHEAYDVCGRAGINLIKNRADEVADIQKISEDVFPLHYPSMYQDLSRGRKTEVDYINGFIVRLGQKYNYPCPTHQFLTDCVHITEMVAGCDD